MNIQPNFEDILRDAKNVYANLRAGASCPPEEMLPDYVYGDLSEREYRQMTGHVKTCEHCRVQVLKLEADCRAWENTLDSDPDAALAAALGPEGIKVWKTSLSPKTLPLRSLISEIKESLITWMSPLWEPMWAGEMLTAADMPEQDRSFEMDQGEYINLSCYWQGKNRDLSPHIRLSWNANILTYSKLWARFSDPRTMEILAEFCLGTDLSGERVLDYEELGFDPSSRKWAVSMIVEAAQ